ncbi:hypothetical protein F5B21DRAFT_506484 [Xylaria acuta]|nr:hypothetical protein F5B21DRAFT_506484 [Xylaria acuta]
MGFIGFAQNLEADLDNTAQEILFLTFLGQSARVGRMIETFETEGHFRTLHFADTEVREAYLGLLVELRRGNSQDKWNSSHHYSSLVLVETIVGSLALIDNGRLAGLLGQDLEFRVLIAIFQACLWTLLKQEDNGPWNSSIEKSARGVLILSEARRVAMSTDLESPLVPALDRGLAYLRSFQVSAPAPLWIDKVTSSCVVIRNSYVLAALRRDAAAPPEQKVAASIFNGSRAVRGRKHVKLLKMTALFSRLPEWQIRASMIESTSYNNCRHTFAPATFLYEMMVISYLNYKADEFIEVCAGTVFQGCHDIVLGSVGVDDSSYAEVLLPLTEFVSHVSNHPYILEASSWDWESMKRELRTFLHAHYVPQIPFRLSPSLPKSFIVALKRLAGYYPKAIE